MIWTLRPRPARASEALKRGSTASASRYRAVMFITRFAPSPTGRLHKGHAFSALLGHRLAQDAGGQWLLRIEDIDPTRCRPEFEAGILEDLAWLGLEWPSPVRRQSDHLADYAATVQTLRQRSLMYRCFRTRKTILDAIGDAPHGSVEAARPGPHRPDEEAAMLDQGLPFAWRLSLDRARAELGDTAWTALSFVEQGRGPDGQTGRIQLGPKPPVTSSWPARTQVPLITWSSPTMTPCKGSATSFAATTCSRRRISRC